MHPQIARFILASLFVLVPQIARASITVNPQRVILGDGDRETTVLLLNRGETEATYRVSMQNLQMLEDGKFEPVPRSKKLSNERFADEFLRFSPKQVTLKAHEVQTVRLLVRRPANLPDREYLTFLRLSEVPSNVRAESRPKVEGKKRIGINIKPIYSISIPVILRKGSVSAEVTLTKPKFEPGATGGWLEFEVRRSGEASVYGDFEVTFRPNKSLDAYAVGALAGVSVLPPLERRVMRIQVKAPEGKSLNQGVFEIKYVDKEKADGKVLGTLLLVQ